MWSALKGKRGVTNRESANQKFSQNGPNVLSIMAGSLNRTKNFLSSSPFLPMKEDQSIKKLEIPLSNEILKSVLRYQKTVTSFRC